MRKSEIRDFDAEIKNRAIEFGLCETGQREWGKDNDIDDLVQKYVDGIEFILDHPNFITDTFLIEQAGRKRLHEHGIFIDEVVSILDPGTIVLNGHCEGNVTATNFSASEIYLRGDGDIELNVRDAAIVHVNIYDHATINVHCDRFAKCFIYQYGGKVNFDGDGNIIVRDRINR